MANVVTDLRQLACGPFQDSRYLHIGAGIRGRLHQIAGENEFQSRQRTKMIGGEFWIALDSGHGGSNCSRSEINLAQELSRFVEEVYEDN